MAQVQLQDEVLPILELIKEFLSSPSRNRWVENLEIRLYLRKAHHVVDGRISYTLDIANVKVNTSGNGTFTRMLDSLEAIVADTELQGIYVENVLTPKFSKFFIKRGYTKLAVFPPYPIDAPCFYKQLDPNT